MRRRRKGYQADGPSACAGDLEELRGRAFVLKEGVDYRVKVSFKVRLVSGALCPLAGHVPAALTPRGPCPKGSLLPWVPAFLSWIPCPKWSLIPMGPFSLMSLPHRVPLATHGSLPAPGSLPWDICFPPFTPGVRAPLGVSAHPEFPNLLGPCHPGDPCSPHRDCHPRVPAPLDGSCHPRILASPRDPSNAAYRRVSWGSVPLLRGDPCCL